MSGSNSNKTPYGCQECKRKRIKCSDVLVTTNINNFSLNNKPCKNCVKANKTLRDEIECIYLNLFEQKELRRIRKVLKKKISTIKNGNTEEENEATIDNYTLIKRYIRGNEMLDYDDLTGHLNIAQPSNKVSNVSNVNNVPSVNNSNSLNNITNPHNLNNVPNPNLIVSQTASLEDTLKSATTTIDSHVINTPTAHDFNNNWDFMFDDIMNLMNTINSDTNSMDNDDMHEALEQDIVFTKNETHSNSTANLSVSWEIIQRFFDAFKVQLEVSEKDIAYFKIFYEKISYWIYPYQLIDKGSVINDVFFNYILSKKSTTDGSFMRDPLILGMLSLAAKFKETISKTKANGALDSSSYAELAIVYLNAKIVQITEANDNCVLLNECIGSLAITILLLVTYNSSQNGSNWRRHQRGAKNIYFKYLRNKNANSASLSKEELNLLLLFKLWFPTFDMLASFITLEKGTLTTEEYNLYFKENGLNHIYSSVFFKKSEDEDSWYNMFQGYGHNLMKLIVHLLDFVAVHKENKKKEVTLSFFFNVMSKINSCRNFYYKKNSYGLLDEADPDFSGDQLGVILIGGKKYSIFDLTHSSHTNLVTIVFLQRLSNKKNSYAGLIANSFAEMRQLLSFMFKKDFDYKKEFESDLHELLKNPNDVDLDTFTDKFTFQECINTELKGDFKLLMCFSAIQMYSTSLTKEKEYTFEDRCKMLGYCHNLYLNCGSTGCFTSFKYFISIWKQFDNEKDCENNINNIGLYNKSLPFI